MDPFTAASGIAGLIAIAIKTIQIVGEYVESVHEHKKLAETLQKELELMKQVLDQLKTLIDNEKRNGRLISVDDRDRNTVLGKAFLDCTKTIEQIQDKLVEPVNRFKRAMAKLQWPFDQKEILRMVDNLRRYTQLFQLSLTVTNCELLSKTFDAAGESLTLQRDNCKEIQKLCASVPQMAQTAEETLKQTEILLKLVPTFLQDVSLDIREIGIAQRKAEQREHGKTSLFPAKFESAHSHCTRWLRIQEQCLLYLNQPCSRLHLPL
jgi:Fungal N-terminal domain of STAND proteins